MSQSDDHVTVEHILQARERIKSAVRRTPLERSRWLSSEAGCEALLKLECFQVTGSFKIRGAMAKLTALTAEEKSRGILTVSAGNHGAAVAHCAQALDLDAVVIVPESASRAKVEAISRYPVTLVKQGAGYDEAEQAARRIERETGRVFVSPYNDAEVIAGQGTLAIEIIEDQPRVDTLVVPVGGGGLIAGAAIAAKAINPNIKIFGVESAASPTAFKALEAGRIIEIEEERTLADGLAGNIEPGAITFPIIERLVDAIILVSEDAIRNAIARVAREDHLIIEGAAAASVAALNDDRLRGRTVAAILTGRNISLDVFLGVVAGK